MILIDLKKFIFIYLSILGVLLFNSCSISRHRKILDTPAPNLHKAINYKTYRTATSFNSRIRFIVMHYTALSFQESIKHLVYGKLSAHYLIPDISDSTFLKAGYKKQEIFALVDEKDRAWHAGISSWGNRTNLNDTSIGIEIVNLANQKNGVFNFPPFHPEQIKAVKSLALFILSRYPEIQPVNIIGHSDIAPTRKNDPGPKFPWYELYLAGVGAWYDEETKNCFVEEYNCSGLPSKDRLLRMFAQYGYDTSSVNTDADYRFLIRAFQLHFYPENIDGNMDAETAGRLAALIKKYF